MSAQQPRAYNYVTNEDFSANASTGGQNNSYVPPTQYQQEQQQHYTPVNDEYRPSATQQHYYPPTEPPPPPSSTKPHTNQQTHPPAPPINFGSHPQPGQANNNFYKPPPSVPQESAAPYGDPSQQWGQVSFDEKFKPPSNKPKWNDVFSRCREVLILVMGCNIVSFCLHCVCCHVGIYHQCVPVNV